jgi:PAS domain S-box-containing protein
MLAYLERLFDETSLSPHGLCLLWRPELIWLHVGSDAIIALAYFSIPFALAVFVWRRPDVRYGWVFWSFATFILACGMTHVMSIWTLFVPDYALEGGVKGMTAVASIATAAALWPLLPRVLALPSTAEFSRVGRALDETERQLRLLVDGATDTAIIMLDPEGKVADWNAGAQRIMGWSRSEILGQHFSRFYTDESRRDRLPDHALEVAAGAGKYQNEVLHVRKDGSRFWASVAIDALHDQAGGLIGFAKISQDITGRREAEERLRSAREQLFQSQKMEAVGQLTGGVAHDFNNLLTVVIGNLEIAQRTLDSWSEGAQERVRRSVRNAFTGAQRAATLTQRLLAFSRRQPLSPTPINLGRLLPAIGDLIRGSLGETIDVELVSGGGVWLVEADATHLESALLNLAINARDAMPSGGKLTIETSNVLLDEEYCRRNAEVVPGQYVRICVTDIGTGMAPDVLTHAFEPFFTTKTAGQGTGLGLSQVYGFLKQSGGHATIYSEPDHGTTVNLYLPRLSVPVPIEIAPAEAEPVIAGEASETILVVEDSDDVREYMVETLTDLKYRVLEAANGEAALRVAEREAGPIALLLTDVVLPGINGRQLAETLQARRPGLRVLYVTGYSRNAIVHQGRLDAGVTMLQKPLTRATLSNAVRDVLEGRGNRRTPRAP